MQDEHRIAGALAALVQGEMFAEDFCAEVAGIDDETIATVTFKDAGVLTHDEGFLFRLPDRRKVYVTVQVQ